MAETVEDLNQLREMLHHFDTLHIAFQDDDYPYIVPMNFGIGEDQDKIVLYIYTPREGKMTHLIKENPHETIAYLEKTVDSFNAEATSTKKPYSFNILLSTINQIELNCRYSESVAGMKDSSLLLIS